MSMSPIVKIFILLLTTFTTFVPGSVGSIMLAPALWVVWSQRETLDVDVNMKLIILAFISYVIFFTIFSMDISRSSKGLYDMLRGGTFFLLALTLVDLLRRNAENYLITTLPLLFIAGNVMFPRDGFLGYYENPNNVAVSLVVYILFALPFTPKNSSKWLLIIRIIGVVLGGYLLLLTNSRGAWLGFGIAMLAFLLMNKQLRSAYRLMFAAGVIGIGAIALFHLNFKGFSLRERDGLWFGLLNATLKDSPWIGFGINSAKDVISQYGLITQTAHNLELEIIVSSGVVGLIYLIVLFLLLLGHFSRFPFQQNALFWIGITCLVAFVTMAQFDLKFSSFKFMAITSFSLGLIYAQRMRVR